MTTPLRRAGIPARAAATAAGVVVALAAGLLTGCSSDDSSTRDASSVSIGTPATVEASTAAAPSSAAPATTVALPPEDTSDIPPAVPSGTNDIPVFTPPETSDVPVFISVSVGVDDSPARVENAPLGASVTIDVVDLQEADEYHPQGYELGAGEVNGPGQTYTFNFTANVAGDFVLESLTTGAILLTLHVG